MARSSSTADRFRTQVQNREDAIGRLVALLSEAAIPPKRAAPHARRSPPSSGAMDAKTRRGGIKQLRTSKPVFD